MGIEEKVEELERLVAEIGKYAKGNPTSEDMCPLRHNDHKLVWLLGLETPCLIGASWTCPFCGHSWTI